LPRTGFNGLVNLLFNFISDARRRQWPYIRLGQKRIADHQAIQFFDKQSFKQVIDLFVNDESFRRDTGLTIIYVPRCYAHRSRGFDVSRGHDDERITPA